MTYLEISKRVGWDKREIYYPTWDEIELADVEQLLVWNRFLKAPDHQEQVKMLRGIIERLDEGRRKLDELSAG